MAVARLLVFALVLARALGGCVLDQPCGWDDAIAVDTDYDVELLESYTPESTLAVYFDEHDLIPQAPACSGFTDVNVGDVCTLRAQEPVTGQTCSIYTGEFASPRVDLGTPLPLFINFRSKNQISVSGRWDFGDGCHGIWDFTVPAPNDDPFQPQSSSIIPIVLVYRVFEAPSEAGPACAAFLGREPESGGFRCGDAYIASMARAAAP